jgi:hypothetical protein
LGGGKKEEIEMKTNLYKFISRRKIAVLFEIYFYIL